LPMAIGEMAERVAARCREVLGFLPPIHFGPAAAVPAGPLIYDSSKLQRTGFTPSRDLNQEIDATLLFCREMFA
jgi:UDP-glucose 4-epimerase